MHSIIVQCTLLVLVVAGSGQAVLHRERQYPSSFQKLLIAAGGYLFGMTATHLLPELFQSALAPQRVGFCLLCGFFLQLLLDLFSGGIEHGHAPTSHKGTVVWALLGSMWVHGFMDGVVLSGVLPATHQHAINGVLVGILLHKVPTTLVLTGTLRGMMAKRRTVWKCLLFFALSSPVGLVVSRYGIDQNFISERTLATLWSVASGSFLHIAATIFFEASPAHRLSLQHFFWGLLGAAIAAITECWH